MSSLSSSRLASSVSSANSRTIRDQLEGESGHCTVRSETGVERGVDWRDRRSHRSKNVEPEHLGRASAIRFEKYLASNISRLLTNTEDLGGETAGSENHTVAERLFLGEPATYPDVGQSATRVMKPGRLVAPLPSFVAPLPSFDRLGMPGAGTTPRLRRPPRAGRTRFLLRLGGRP